MASLLLLIFAAQSDAENGLLFITNSGYSAIYFLLSSVHDCG